MTAGGDERRRTVPTEVALQVRAAARSACRSHGITDQSGDPDRMAVRLLAAAAGLEAGLAGVEGAEAERLRRSCGRIFRRAYESSAAAGQSGNDGGS